MMAYSTLVSGRQFENDYKLFNPEVTDDPYFREGYYYLGNYYLFEKNDFNKADENYNLASHDREKIISFVDNSSLFTNWAIVKIRKNDNVSAESLIKKSLELDGSNQENIYNLALMYWEMGDFDKTIELLEQNEKDWNFAEAYLLLSNSYFKKGQTAKASENLNKALLLLPQDDRRIKEMEKLIEEISKYKL